MKFVTAQDIKDLMIKENVFKFKGSITINLNNTSVVIKRNDIIGNALQEWLCQYLRDHDIYFRETLGQEFPDFYLSKENNENLCEMKTFLSKRSPAFDIANFYGYIDSIKTSPYRLNSDYLIFAYDSDESGNITIKDIWCKKVWEITGPSKDYVLKCQRKKGQIVNIRPANFKTKNGKLKPFNSLEEFVAALYKTHLSTTNQTRISKEWLKEVISGYEEYSHYDLTDGVNKLI